MFILDYMIQCVVVGFLRVRDEILSYPVLPGDNEFPVPGCKQGSQI